MFFVRRLIAAFLISAVVLLAASRPTPLCAQEEPAELAPSVPADGEAKDEKPQKEEPAGEHDGAPRSLVLPDNGDLRRKLEKVRGQIDARNYTEGARELGRFLQDSEIQDFFLNRDEDRRGGQSFLAEVRRMLSELPPAGQAAYRTLFEPLARSRLNAAVARGDEAALRDVAARFPGTKPGDEALFRLSIFLRDHGRVRAAVGCLERLRSRPESFASDERWAAFVAGFAPHEARQPVGGGDWSIWRGGPERNGSAPARAPFLAPRWSQPTAGDSATSVALDRAWQWYCEGNAIAFPMLSPLASGDLIFARTRYGVSAHDFDTGRVRWRVPSDDGDENAGVDQILWHEPAGGAFAVDDECVYLLDDLKLGDPDEGLASSNALSAQEHGRGREGNLRWQVGGVDGGAEPRLAGAYFLGPPLCWQANLYLLAEWKGALALVVLDRTTGRLAWSQELALVEQAISLDLLRRAAGASPSISSDEIIVCPTSGGAIVAVDLTTQSLLWAYRYPRETSQPESVGEPEIAPRVDQSNRWLDGTLSIGAGRVVAGPPESQQIHCLDLRSGRPIWTADRDGGLFVACLTGDHAIVVGRHSVRAQKLEDGEVAWTLPLAAGAAPPDQSSDRIAAPAGTPAPTPVRAYPAGRGVFAGRHYYLPVTSAAVLEIDLSSGTLVAEHKSPRQVPPGNLIWHRGRFIAHGPTALEVFDERERLAGDVEAQIRADPRDAAALLRRGELELSEGRLTEAIASFRAAHKSAPTPRTKSRLISTLLDAVRQNATDAAQYSAELDSLLGP